MKPHSGDTPSWYLDVLVAEQKRQIHQEWIRGSIGRRRWSLVLKTDLFEEAYGRDRIFFDLFADTRLAIGVDLDTRTVRAAAGGGGPGFRALACDVRWLPLSSGSVDVIVSTSTLDHFESREGLAKSLDELARVLRPEGALLITLDNPWNPFYHLLRWGSRMGLAPFELGLTVPLSGLKRMLVERGFRIEDTRYLIHNPRGISTLLFLALRKGLGRHATTPIRVLLAMFAVLGKLPSRAITGCFAAISATKIKEMPASEPARPVS